MHIDFCRWKDEFEECNGINYIKSTGSKVINNESVEYYYCNRTGFFNTVSSGKRSLKSQGSCKLNSHCTASLTVRKTVEGTVEVEICSTHYKHTVSLEHLRIPKSKRIEIAKKLSDGVTIDRILDDVRDNVCVDENGPTS